jgi:RNA polymerase sigma-70 factor, ECF subfamily
MTQTDSFPAIAERLRSGEDDAAREVFQRFARQLLALTRRQFEQRLAHKVDLEGVVQSAFKSFFVRHREGKLRADNWNALWGLLTLITLRKCADRVEYHRAARRDIGREAATSWDDVQPWQRALDREPSPHEVAVLAETVENLFRTTPGAERPILELSLQGLTAAEIGLRLGRALRTVHRVREQIRKRLEGMRACG